MLGWHLLHTRWGLDRAFGIEPAVLRRWLAFVEAAYNAPLYHNATHAADVLQARRAALGALRAPFPHPLCHSHALTSARWRQAVR